jgi:hypothetical protein
VGDFSWEGLIARELDRMVRLGMKPLKAILSVTMHGAARAVLCLAPLVLSVPAENAHAGTLVGLTSTNGLVVLTSSFPVAVSTPIPITGLVVGETVVAIDVRPSTGALYALAVKASTAHLYVVNVFDGLAVALGPAFALPQSPGALVSSYYGMTFEGSDQIRVVGYSSDHFRLNPGTGVPTALAKLSASTINSVAAAADGTVYGINDLDSGDELVRIGGPGGNPSPDLGAVTVLGPLGAEGNASSGFDISQTGIPFALLSGAGQNLYRLQLSPPGETLIGPIGAGLTLVDIAVLSPRGDANSDGSVDVLDVFYLINSLFAGGPPPPP